MLSLSVMIGCALSWWSLGMAMGERLPWLLVLPSVLASGSMSFGVLLDRHLERTAQRRRSYWASTIRDIRELPELPSG